MKDNPYQTIEMVQNMPDKARECEKDSEGKFVISSFPIAFSSILSHSGTYLII